MKQQVTVLIPAFNEQKYIGSTIYGIKASGIVDRVVVVDDGSRDNTAQVASDLGAEVIRLKRNRGKGYAINYGLGSVCSEIIVFLDADIGKSSSELTKLVEPVMTGKADMTIGIFPPAVNKGGFGLVKKLARLLVYASTGKILKSGLSGQRAFRRDVLLAIEPVPDGFAAEIGMNIKAMKMGYTVIEVPVKMTHRETKRNLKGFIHRGRQFFEILRFYLREARSNKW